MNAMGSYLITSSKKVKKGTKEMDPVNSIIIKKPFIVL